MASAEEESSSYSSDESPLITREQPKASRERLRSYTGSSSVAHSDYSYSGVSSMTMLSLIISVYNYYVCCQCSL